MSDIFQGDCLDLTLLIERESIDLILTDLPYGTTGNPWDSVIPLPYLWHRIRRVLKPDGVFISTAGQPFTSQLISSNFEHFREILAWDKRNPVGHLNAKKKHLQVHEDIVIFSPAKLGNYTYNPQMRTGKFRLKGGKRSNKGTYNTGAEKATYTYNDQYYPTSIINVGVEHKGKRLHSTQKPVALYEYLIKTYSNEGETVLDICAGSGTTGLAALNTDRDFILMEKDPAIFLTMHTRVTDYQELLLDKIAIKK